MDHHLYSTTQRAMWMGAAVLLFGITRVVYLDSDMPPWTMINIQPIDEMYYNVGAFNIFRYGSITHQLFPEVPDDTYPVHIFQNLITGITLLAFGNTFYGLRMAPVLLSCLSFAALLWVVKRTVQWHGTPSISTPLVAATAVIVWVDFSFWIIGVANDPQCYSLFIVCMVLALCTALDSAPARTAWICCFVIGFVCVFGFTFVYLYNLFVPCGVGIALLARIHSVGWRQGVREIGACAAGGATCLLIHEAVLYAVWGTNSVELLRTLSSQLGQDRVGAYSSLQKVIVVAVTNIFRINPGLLFLLIFCLPIFVTLAIRNDRVLERAVLSILIFRIIEGQFQTDYYIRKLIVIFPLVIIVIATSLAYLNKFLTSNEIRTWQRIGLLFWAMTAAAIAVYCIAHTPDPADRIQRLDMQLYYAGLAGFCVALIGIALMLVQNSMPIGRTVQRTIASLVLVLFLVPNAVAIAKYRLLSPRYEHRDAMKALSPQLDGKVVAAGWSFGMRLYNDSIPILNGYSFHYYTRLNVYMPMIRRVFDQGWACCMLLGEKTFHGVFPDGGGFRQIDALDFGDVQQLQKMGLYVAARDRGDGSDLEARR